MICINSYYRCYTDPTRRERDTLRSTFLIDEEERPLKSFKNYKEAIDHMMQEAPQLVQYMQNNILFTTGDWPTWYFQKKIIAQVITLYFTCYVQSRTII